MRLPLLLILLPVQAYAGPIVGGSDAGVYNANAAGYTLVNRTTRFCAKLNTTFGLMLTFSPAFGDNALPVIVSVTSPAANLAQAQDAQARPGGSDTSVLLQAGYAQFGGLTFTGPSQLQAGIYHVVVTHGGQVLLDQPFEVSLDCRSLVS